MKIVIYLIEVPSGDYCWDGKESCQFFDNDGGHGHCGLNFHVPFKITPDGRYKKAQKCISLSVD